MVGKEIQNAPPDFEKIAADYKVYAPQAAMLDRLCANPSQTLLLEGGTENGRINMALYWAMANNCREKQPDQNGLASPCLQCSVCRQLMALESHDLLLFDGRISNRQDEEEPGLFRALRMENMRDLKVALGSAPGHLSRRVVIITGMSVIREEALNSLLKILEEPNPYTLFCLLVAQREQILPTLVSRSFCMTLPWKTEIAPAISPFVNELGEFLMSGRGFLNSVSQKGALGDRDAENLLLACQAALANALKVKCLGRKSDDEGNLPLFFEKLAANPQKALLAQNWINEAQEMLALGVSPARCLEGFSARLHVLGMEN